MNHILLLHGAIGSAVHFNKLKTLLEKDFVVHAIDFPGHGGSEMPSSFSIEFFAEQVEEYCRINSLSGIDVFGYSMGGYVAVYLASIHPRIFKKIITLGTMFYWDEHIAAKEISRLQPSIIEMKLPEFAESLRKLHHPNSWQEVLEKTGEMLSRLGNNNLLQKEVLQKIQTPVMIMLGDRDKMVSREKTFEVYETLPLAQLAVLPGTPHLLEMCDTVLLELMIRKFVE